MEVYHITMDDVVSGKVKNAPSTPPDGESPEVDLMFPPHRSAICSDVGDRSASSCAGSDREHRAREADGSVLRRPYLPATLPPVRTADSNRLHDLIRAGKLYLTAKDAVALALENNLDIEVARYNQSSLEWRLERSQAGGSLPGVPSNASQTSSVTNGQGVLGSQAAAGVSGGGGNNTGRSTGNATITQVGPVAQTFDPSIQGSTVFSHKTLPQFNQVQTFNPILIDNARIYSSSYQQGFESGGSVSVSYNNHYLNENAITDVLNPSVAPTLSVSFQQNLLQGFGAKVGGRQIEVARINLRTSDLNFRSQLITTIVSVLNSYYALVGDYENLKAKQTAQEAAQKLLADSRTQVQIGSLADIDLITAESQVASTGQDFVNAEVALEQQEVVLKNLISRTGIGDPLLASVRIVPLDRIVIPENDNDIPAIRELVQRASLNRNDLKAETASLEATEVSNLGDQERIASVFAGFCRHKRRRYLRISASGANFRVSTDSGSVLRGRSWQGAGSDLPARLPFGKCRLLRIGPAKESPGPGGLRHRPTLAAAAAASKCERSEAVASRCFELSSGSAAGASPLRCSRPRPDPECATSG